MLIHVADTAVEVPSKSVDCQKKSLWHCNVGGFKVDILLIFCIYYANIFYCYHECIDIEYDNKVNFVLNVYAYYFKTKSQTLFKLCVCFPSGLHIVDIKWVTKILME